MALATARRSAASSPSVELTNTRRRRSGVWMTASSRGLWLTDHSDQAPPRKSATSHPGQQAPRKYPTLVVPAGFSSRRSALAACCAGLTGAPSPPSSKTASALPSAPPPHPPHDGHGLAGGVQSPGEAHGAGQQHRGEEDQVGDAGGGSPVELVRVAGERDRQQNGEQE